MLLDVAVVVVVVVGVGDFVVPLQNRILIGRTGDLSRVRRM